MGITRVLNDTANINVLDISDVLYEKPLFKDKEKAYDNTCYYGAIHNPIDITDSVYYFIMERKFP